MSRSFGMLSLLKLLLLLMVTKIIRIRKSILNLLVNLMEIIKRTLCMQPVITTIWSEELY
jgi:hypothetical protein